MLDVLLVVGVTAATAATLGVLLRRSLRHRSARAHAVVIAVVIVVAVALGGIVATARMALEPMHLVIVAAALGGAGGVGALLGADLGRRLEARVQREQLAGESRRALLVFVAGDLAEPLARLRSAAAQLRTVAVTEPDVARGVDAVVRDLDHLDAAVADLLEVSGLAPAPRTAPTGPAPEGAARAHFSVAYGGTVDTSPASPRAASAQLAADAQHVAHRPGRPAHGAGDLRAADPR